MRVLYSEHYLEASKERKETEKTLSYWQSLPDDTGPIPITPEPHDHWGSSLDEDTIRITGSANFINSLLVRLKDLMKIETFDVEIKTSLSPTNYEHAGGVEPNYEFKFCCRYRNPKTKLPKGPVRVQTLTNSLPSLPIISKH